MAPRPIEAVGTAVAGFVGTAPAAALTRRVADPVSLLVVPPAVRNTSGWEGVAAEVLVEAVRTAERLGALAGATPSESYFVQCGPTTMTETDLALGVVNVLVGFAPLRPAEFLQLTFSVEALPP